MSVAFLSWLAHLRWRTLLPRYRLLRIGLVVRHLLPASKHCETVSRQFAKDFQDFSSAQNGEILMIEEDGNLKVFSSPQVVELYANSSGLQPAEIYAFDKFVHQGAAILDVGVGCGRTTPYLAPKSRHYVGVDYVNAMIDICAAKFPENIFCCADATNLIRFEDGSFDIVVFSFNGLDAISTREGRRRCFSEVSRVLASGGLFIFSAHNAKMVLDLPSLDNAGLIRKAWRLARAAITSVPFTLRLLQSGAFRTGSGYYLDPVHGGIMTYCSNSGTDRT